LLISSVLALAPQTHHRHHRVHHNPYTGYVVEGRVSTFGYLTGDSEGTTADGGSTARPCIAVREDRTLGHRFIVTLYRRSDRRVQISRSATLLHCDWGPAAFTGRSIDVTGLGDRALGFSPTSFPTEAWGVARELK
jgi:hypothetical protein